MNYFVARRQEGCEMKVLLLIDIQNGFCPGGNLAVEGGHEIVPIVNALIENGAYDLIVASQDWHPANHGSFASQHEGKNVFEMGELAGVPQMMWPDHCVQGTQDAELHPDLSTSAIAFIQRKGENPLVDSYSAFKDNAGDAVTGLDAYLRDKGVTELDLCGLATDYCVRYTAEDAVHFLPGVKVRFIQDASRGITAVGIADALASMRETGVDVVNSADILQ
jgi:nicotinamidase/pyrazinamidase